MNSNEFVVAKVTDLKNGEMKAVNVNNVDVLLCKIDDAFYAVGAYCTHYGAPLEDGVLSGDRIVCPWHHACFHAKNGDLLEPPALDALPAYDVWIEDGKVLVKLPEEISHHRVPKMVHAEPTKDDRTFVILGGGAAGNMAAQTLREDGFQGRIVMITQENRTPYDRPNLSKEYLQGEAEPDWMPLRPEDFYRDNGIELLLNKKVTKVHAQNKRITFSDNNTLHYDKLLIATGGAPRTLDVPGRDLKNVFTLRSFDDSDRIIAASKNASKAVIIGASFIGMETAYSLHHRKLDVIVVGRESVPFQHVFGEEIGGLVRQLHAENGITFKLGQTAAEFEGSDKVEAVVLQDDDRIEAELVVVGIGVQPATDFIEGIDLQPDGSVKVDEFFHAGNDVYAAGDIATFPYWYSGTDIRIEHWRAAEQQGRIAAHNIAGKKTPFRSVPFFWTTQAGIHFRYVGYSSDWDGIIVDGDISAQDFVAYYVKGNRVQAAAGCHRDRDMAAIEELMRLNKMPSADKLKGQSVDLISLL